MIRMISVRLRPLIWFAFFAGSAASAQAPSLPKQSAVEVCELHVWPSPGLESITEGWVRNHPQNEALRDASGKALGLADAIPPRVQLDAIASLDLGTLFRLGGVTLIAHPDPLPATPTGAPVVRHAFSTAPCYVELIVKHLVFAKNVLSGGALQAFFVFRQFTQDKTRSFTSMADTPLTIFPWKSVGEEEQGKAELNMALRSDLRIFAQYAAKANMPLR